MRILITGGAGYIGSHTVLQLRDEGHFTVVYDNLSGGYENLVFSDVFVKGDIQDKVLVKKTIKEFGIDAVVHFAAFIEAGQSMSEPEVYYRNNAISTLMLLEAVLEAGIKHFVFSSTAALFGYPERVPIDEECTLAPINVYGQTKLVVEQALRWYSEIRGLRYIALRYFNAAGADKELRTGEMHDPETHIIPLALQAAYGKREKLYLFGTDYKTKDGTCIRDYIHVSDLAKAHTLALDYLGQGGHSDVFNLGSENGNSVREVLEVTQQVTGRDFSIEETDRRPGDPPVLIASSRKIRSRLGWKPEFTDLRDIITTADNWYKKSIDL